MDLLSILYPGFSMSHGSIQEVLVQAETMAKTFNESRNFDKVEAAALDKLFRQGSPVLAGVYLDIGAVALLAKCETRSGKDWKEVIEGALNFAPREIVHDGGLGIASGVDQSLPETEQRDDSFHATYNATLQPYLYLQKYAQPGFLEMFRAWYNLRTRRWLASREPQHTGAIG